MNIKTQDNPIEVAKLVEGNIQGLTTQKVSEFVKDYLERKDLASNDDPYSDMARFVKLAYDMPGVRAIQPTLPAGTLALEKNKWRAFIKAAAEYLYTINPSHAKDDWAFLFASVLAARYGGNYVRIRKRPKLDKMFDADRMNLADWQEKYDMSRRHYFKLRKEALLMRQSEAKASQKK